MILAALLTATTLAPGCTDPAAIAWVHDGDTVKRCDRQRLRLIGFDAPELRGSPSCVPARRARHWCDYDKGDRARRALERFLAGGVPVVHYSGRSDYYRRPLVRIAVNGRDAGEYLKSLGLAR